MTRTPEPGAARATADHFVTFDLGGRQGGVTVTTKNGGISEILTGPLSTSRIFNLGLLLQNYGQPSTVFVTTFPRRGPFGLPFMLVMFYGEDRFMVMYQVEGQVKGEEVEGCFGSTGPYLWTWSQTEEWDLDRIRDETLGVDPTQDLRGLEDVTELDIPNFSMKFLSSAACLRTPASEWDQ